MTTGARGARSSLKSQLGCRLSGHSRPAGVVTFAGKEKNARRQKEKQSQRQRADPAKKSAAWQLHCSCATETTMTNALMPRRMRFEQEQRTEAVRGVCCRGRARAAAHWWRAALSVGSPRSVRWQNAAEAAKISPGKRESKVSGRVMRLSSWIRTRLADLMDD